MLIAPITLRAQDDRTYLIQAAFVYRFLSFVEFPDSAFHPADTIMRVGILGDSPFGKSFDSVEGSSISGRTLTFNTINAGNSLDSLKDYHLIYVTRSMDRKLPSIFESLSESPTLTVSELSGFAGSGGMIEFLIKDDQVRFIVNNGVAELAGINIRSNMLRVAEKVIF